jgi:hypothetical protein
MYRDFVLELVSAPGSGATITLPGAAPTGRITWATGFGGASQPFCFYVLDDSLQQEWGLGSLTIGSPSTITRPTVVLGNSAGTTARLNFTDTCRCYSGLPSRPTLAGIDGAIGRNHLINGRFDVRQRGAGPFTANGYTLDRWQHQSAHSSGSFSDSPQAISDADRAVIGDESAAIAYQSVTAGGLNTADFDNIPQAIEGVRRLSGKTVNVSFWAKCASGTASLGIEGVQVFGTGGSPSANVTAIGPVAVQLTTTWTRFNATLSFPSVAGKTLGTNGDDYSQIVFWLSSGASFSARSAGIGIQSLTLSLWGVELVVGHAPFGVIERRHPQIELSLCHRYYQIGQVFFVGVATASGQQFGYCQSLAGTMRATPTITFVAPTLTNAATLLASQPTPDSFVPNIGSVASGGSGFNSVFNANAEL